MEVLVFDNPQAPEWTPLLEAAWKARDQAVKPLRWAATRPG